MLEKLFRLDNKVIVITGATGLLGAKHAEAVACYGGTPILLDLNKKSLEALANELNKKYNTNKNKDANKPLNECLKGVWGTVKLKVPLPYRIDISKSASGRQFSINPCVGPPSVWDPLASLAPPPTNLPPRDVGGVEAI